MKEHPYTIIVSDIIKSPIAVTTEAGDSIFKIINEQFKNDNSVILDFSDIYLIVSTFLNAAIGQLYGQYKSEFLKEHLSFQNLSNDDASVLVKVIERAKEYFYDKDNLEDFFNKTFNNGE